MDPIPGIAPSVALAVAGLALVVFFAQRLVEGVVRTSRGFGVSTFLVAVVFVGFDPENLAVGAAGSYERVFGIALGSIVGAAMVATALAFGVTALLAPMRFRRAPRRVLAVGPLSVLLAGALAFDGTLSRADGAALLVAYAAAVVYLYLLGRRGVRVEPGGEVAEVLAEDEPRRPWRSLARLLVSLAAIVAGSELLVAGSRTIIAGLGLSETAYGMTILALLVSAEELARELPAALRGRSEISFGNVLGSMMAFFLFNAGVIALVRPVEVPGEVLRFHLPVALATSVFLSALAARRTIPRWAGGALLAAYAAFVAGSFLDGLPPP